MLEDVPFQDGSERKISVTDKSDSLAEAVKAVAPEGESKLVTIKKGVKKVVRWTLFFGLLIGAGLFWWQYYYTFSNGSRTGLVQKISHKGNVFKTYEGEMILRSIVSTGGVGLASEKFEFSIANDSIAKLVMQFEGKNARLTYEEKKGTLPWRGDSRYIIVGASAAE